MRIKKCLNVKYFWGDDFPRINSIYEESSQRDPLHWKCMLIFELPHMKEIEIKKRHLKFIWKENMKIFNFDVSQN
jgi:hypothetical protein